MDFLKRRNISWQKILIMHVCVSCDKGFFADRFSELFFSLIWWYLSTLGRSLLSYKLCVYALKVAFLKGFSLCTEVKRWRNYIPLTLGSCYVTCKILVGKQELVERIATRGWNPFKNCTIEINASKMLLLVVLPMPFKSTVKKLWYYIHRCQVSLRQQLSR